MAALHPKVEADVSFSTRDATGITIPPEILDRLGGGKRPAVRVTINGHTYPSKIRTMNGVCKIPVSGAVRAAAKSTPGTSSTSRSRQTTH